MASQRLLGLPPVSSELKPITPYLQRADELKTQEPIVAYWCAYYAAQVGISIKARDAPSRELLLALLGLLERLKEEIGPNDAIDMEAASAAYVENFALKVFSMADNEDRAGRSSRSTAKKFLAAANFLEVLKTFPKSDVADSNEEKIRYAKWKAADIAKAFREGRKPTPGPAGADLEQQFPLPSPPTQPTTSTLTGNSSTRSTITPVSPPAGSSPPHHSHVTPKRSSPPRPQIDPEDIARANAGSSRSNGHLTVGSGWANEGEATPGSWSTAATPGTAIGNTPSTPHWDQGSPTRSTHSRHSPTSHRNKPRSGSGSSSGSSGGVLKNSKKAWVSDEQEGKGSPPMSSSPPKKVTFTPSVAGDTESEVSEVPPSVYKGPTSIYTDLPPQPSPTIPSPPHFTPGFVSEPYPTPPVNIYAPSSSPPRNVPLNNIYAPSSSPPRHPPVNHNIYAPPPPPHVPSPPAELTPNVIAKAQKHCRFAISALDYEDGEQARKELRAALAILGG
ncbi:Vta1 like-domain-containing protein [Crucibulum laeve]|uniref:Vta1 like-domain-containing protein n=1 Tax=Crucibulum laeve TaxID=68775 RepID=A0A5C3LV55_9AGAR|nr:Vta1 like-domain-containing protein [Crucibulum laeve]